ncbi:MAG: hypothetical protein QNJ34_13755 [Xenococcaceae cyanobacterium MO_188.B29]|nr:hypothetical protein [Xenococcaceae cyanobacterium MO_188.B29]
MNIQKESREWLLRLNCLLSYLAIDFPEDVKMPIEPNQMREQYAVGSLEVRIVKSKI